MNQIVKLILIPVCSYFNKSRNEIEIFRLIS